MKIALILVIFILMNGFLIISNNNLALKDTNSLQKFFTLYGEWISKIGDNFTQITGNVVDLDWAPATNE